MASKRFDKILLPIFLFALFVFSAFALTNNMVARAASNTDISTGGADYSYYRMSQAGAEFFIETMSSRDFTVFETIGYKSKDNRIANVGGLLGYVDPDSSTLSGSAGIVSKNVTVYNSEFLEGLYQSYGNGAPSYVGTSVLIEYQAFGQLLNDLGIDEITFGGAAEDGGTRLIISWAYRLLYLASIMLNVFFNLVFTLLGYANPFRLFEGVADSMPTDASINTVVEGNAIGGDVITSVNDGIKVVKEFISSFYDALHGMSLFVILPISLAITLFMLLVWKQGKGIVGTLKNYLIRLTFVVIGLPLLFACYSTVIDLMGTFTVAENSVSTKVVMSTFCNFEEWAKANLSTTFLYTDSAIGSLTDNRDSGMVDASSAEKIRALCANINGNVYKSTENNNAAFKVENTIAQYHTTLLNPNNTSDSAAKSETIRNVMGLLEQYGNGSLFTSGDYAMYRESGSDPYNVGFYNVNQHRDDHIALSTISIHKAGFDPDKIVQFHEQYGAKVVDKTAEEMKNMVTARFKNSTEYPSIWNDGTLSTNDVNVNGSDGTGDELTLHVNNGGGHLSTMSMYNFLNSNFENGSISVYAPSLSSDEAALCNHYSVTCAGKGLLEWIYVLDGLVLLASITIIGYCYGASMLFSNFKAIFKLVPNVLTGMIGSMRGIAGAVILTFALIIEIIGTCLVYCIANEFLFLIYQLVEIPLSKLMEVVTFGAANHAILSVTANISPILLGVVSIYVIWQFICYALKWRYAIVQATTEAATAMVNKFLGTAVSAPNLSTSAATMGEKVLGAASVATGLGMAASKMDKTGELEGYKNSFAEALGIETKPEGEGTAGTGDVSADSANKDGRISENNPYGVKGGSLSAAEAATAEKNSEELNASVKDMEAVIKDAGGGSAVSDSVEAEINNDSTKNENKNYDLAGADEGASADDTADDTEAPAGGDDTKELATGDTGVKETAETYIANNKETFLASIEGDGTTTEFNPEEGTLTFTNPETGEKSVANLATGEVSVIDPKTGESKSLDGVTYDSESGKLISVDPVTNEATTVGSVVKDSNGNFVQIDGNGATNPGATDPGSTTSAENLTISTDNTNTPSSVVPTQNGTFTVTDMNGKPMGDGFTIVNSDTGAIYTAADHNAGESFTVLNSDGTVFKDSMGASYANMPAAAAISHGDGVTTFSNPSTGATFIAESGGGAGGGAGGFTQPSADKIDVPPVVVVAAPVGGGTPSTSVGGTVPAGYVGGGGDVHVSNYSELSAAYPGGTGGGAGTYDVTNTYVGTNNPPAGTIPSGGDTTQPGSVTYNVNNEYLSAGGGTPAGGTSGGNTTFVPGGVDVVGYSAGGTLAGTTAPEVSDSVNETIIQGDTTVVVNTEVAGPTENLTVTSTPTEKTSPKADGDDSELFAGLTDKFDFSGSFSNVAAAVGAHAMTKNTAESKPSKKPEEKKEKPAKE